MLNRKRLLLVSALVIGVILTIVLIRLASNSKNASEPKDWITVIDQEMRIDISSATENLAYLNSGNQEYLIKGTRVGFIQDGIYLGNYFKKNYTDDTGKTLIRITPNLIPDDTIMDIFIMMRIEDENPVAYIFVDEDWKKKIGLRTMIYWGKDLEYSQKYTYQTVVPGFSGIYVTRIEDDRTRFSDNYLESEGSIVVGDLNSENIKDMSNVVAVRLI